MFAPYRSNAIAYRQLGVETAMADATPHKLIAMLFDGADEQIRKASSAMARADHATKGEALTRAIRILDEGLRASIDDRGGALAANLRDLYSYMINRLLSASVHNDPEPLAEVLKLLGTIADAWSQIAPGSVSTAAAATAIPRRAVSAANSAR